MPSEKVAAALLADAVDGEDFRLETVNSDNDVAALLDANSELELRTPGNIFIGGNILDRGITIPNLISFYYGRNPRVMQADTVLQHSRMYGSRPADDMAVTRFYTSLAVYDRLLKINSFENALREAFEKGAHDQGVVFIETDADQVRQTNWGRFDHQFTINAAMWSYPRAAVPVTSCSTSIATLTT